MSSLPKTLTRVSLASWLVFVALELFVPTLVTRHFSPHWFLLAFLVGAVWWYLAIVRK